MSAFEPAQVGCRARSPTDTGETEAKAREPIGTLAENHVIFRALQGRNIVSTGRDEPKTLGDYLDKRGQAAKARANRGKALLSHMFNKAREWGYTDAPNPCQGVKGFTETGRDRYVNDAEFAAVRAVAHPTVQDALDIALLATVRAPLAILLRLGMPGAPSAQRCQCARREGSAPFICTDPEGL
jgi:hypothetical protein